MIRTALISGLLVAMALPAAAQDRVRLIYPAQQTTVVERTTVTTVQTDTVEAPPLQAPEIDGMGPPPRHRPLDDSSSYPPDEEGTTVEVYTADMPTPDWGAPPPFEDLDQNHDGRISEEEASAYPLLANDFLYAAGKSAGISRSRYQWWVQQAR